MTGQAGTLQAWNSSYAIDLELIASLTAQFQAEDANYDTLKPAALAA
jgi:hypothetical protein